MAEEEKPQTDDELVALLGSFSKKKTVPLDTTPPPKPVAAKPKKVVTTAPPPPPPPPPTEDDEEEEPPQIEKPPIIEPELKPAEKVTKILPPSDLVKPPEPENSQGFQILLAKFGPMVDNISNNYGADRAQIEAAIQYLEGQVKATTPGTRGVSTYVEAWVAALTAKAEINGNATKLLDSVAKLLAAGKSNDLIVNLSSKVSADDIDLEKLLSKEIPQ